MDFTSPRESAAAEAQLASANKVKEFGGLALPELQRALSAIGADFQTDQLGNQGIPKSVKDQFDKVRSGLSSDYASAKGGTGAYIMQLAKQSGMQPNKGQVSGSLLSAANSLDQRRNEAMTNLNFQEANAGMTQFNNLINLMGGGAGAALNLGSQWTAGQGGAIGMLPNMSQGQGALGGGISGASAGASLGPWGAVAGGILGAAGGYFGSG